jgi:hypothetical protein
METSFLLLCFLLQPLHLTAATATAAMARLLVGALVLVCIASHSLALPQASSMLVQ